MRTVGLRLTYPGAVCSEPGCPLPAAVATSFQSLLVPFGFSATYEEGAKRGDEKGKEQLKAALFPSSVEEAIFPFIPLPSIILLNFLFAC